MYLFPNVTLPHAALYRSQLKGIKIKITINIWGLVKVLRSNAPSPILDLWHQIFRDGLYKSPQ